MIKVKYPEVCTGCLICELACSFHHTRKFSRSKSSIRVNKTFLGKKRNIQITILNNNSTCDFCCDLCEDEDYPLCIRFCPEDVFAFERGSKK